MYNDILRKITSLTLLTILLASSAVIGLPNAIPVAHAATNANLFVSAENSQWNNYFAGPQVIQVIVSDPDINRLDQAYGEPFVTVNGKKLRMAQATDGNWYAYFADSKQAQIADSTQTAVKGKGLDFGTLCPSQVGTGGNPGVNVTGIDLTETKGFFVADSLYNTTRAANGIVIGVNGSQNPSATVGGKCNVPGNPQTALGGFGTLAEHVIRENKTLNHAQTAGVAVGQIGIKNSLVWPIIQLYDFASLPNAVAVDYHKSGGDQVVNLTFDRIPQQLITTNVDRNAYPQNSQVFITMNDPQLNVDPTEEDSWTFGTNATNSTLYYQAFTRNGVVDADGSLGMQNLIGNLTSLMFNHNGKLTFQPTAQNVRVVDLQDNGKTVDTCLSSGITCVSTTRGDPSRITTSSLGKNTAPLTFLEQGGVNTGTLGTWDGSKVSQVITVDSPAIRGQSATFRYNDISASIVGGNTFASLTQSAQNNTWASGQRIPVTLTDNDANKNSKISERLFNWDSNVKRMTTMVIGTPFTLSSSGTTQISTGGFTVSSVNASLVGKATIHDGDNCKSGVSVQGATSGVLCFGGTNSTMSTALNSAEDEAFSARPIFNFTQKSTSTPVIGTASALFVDLHTTMQTLRNTIHPTNQTITSGVGNAENFHGFNFFNYDLRTFSSLNSGVTGPSSISKVQIYLVYANNTYTSGNIISHSNGLPINGIIPVSIANSTSLQDFINLNATGSKVDNPALLNKRLFNIPKSASIGLLFNFTTGGAITLGSANPVVADFFSVGLISDGAQSNQRINNGIYRYELEETGDNTGVFAASNQYLMLNQLNIFDPNTYTNVRTLQKDVKFVAIQDMLQSEARAPQVTYYDLGQDGVNTQISAQQDIPTHTGVISFDSKTYKIGDTVTITLKDLDLNVDNDLIDIYTAVTPVTPLATTIQDNATDTVGKSGLGKFSSNGLFGRLVDVQFGQQNIRWSNAIISNPTTRHNIASNGAMCFSNANSNTGTSGGFATSLSATGFSLVETGPSTGIFTGTFEVPDQLCQDGTASSTVGQNIKVNYVDFRDSSGKLVEVSDNAGVKGNTGSVKLDKAVYPVAFGTVGTTADFNQPAATVTSKAGIFPLHRDLTGSGLTSTNTLSNGDVLVHIRVNDQDYNTSPTGTDKIAVGVNDPHHGPVAVQITRQGSSLLLATAGGPATWNGTILNLNGTALLTQSDAKYVFARDLGPMTEIAPDAGIFQADLPIRFTDGPQGTDCPKPDRWTATDGTTLTGEANRFHSTHTGLNNALGFYCVRQGDVLTVTYTDTNDASGHTQTVTDSSTFDLRNGVLQSDKSVYIIGSDMILTLVEPDFNLDSQTAETATLDLIEWDSHAFKNTMGTLGGQAQAFDPKPSTFVETGKDTGIFQSVIKVPKKLNNNLLERGEQIHLEYTDWGPAGSKVVGANSQDIQLTIYTSNFGATVELDQKVYTWTDRVYVTVVAPDHNFDPNLIDIIGDNDENKVTVSTRGNSISNYKLVETGVDTGIFTGYVILTGNANVKGTSGVDGAGLNPTGSGPTGVGPTDGFLPSEEQDGVSVSFEFTRDQTVTGSALIRWNIGEIKWLEASYPANGQGVLQIVDPDMNLNPKAVDKFDTNVWSDSDSGGIKLTMTETGEATGIFQGTVYFTTNFQSSGNRLHVAEGDTVTGEYKDRTLPPPYTPSDQLRLTSTTFIGTIVPPLERAPASNPRIVDSFGNAITGAVKSGQQIQITADLTNGQDRDQPFAYLVQIQDANGVTVSLSWITGTLTAGQSLNPAQSWTPQSSGTYTAQIFVWQSIDNPNALSPPLTTTINVA